MQSDKENYFENFDDAWNPVDPEEEAVDSGEEIVPDIPRLNIRPVEDEQPKLPGHIESPALPEYPASLNDELAEKIKKDPNKLMGCGG